MLSLLQENESLLWVLGLVSVASFLVTLAVVPWVILKLPHDYFAEPQRVAMLFRGMPPTIRVVALLAKNALGAVVVVLGVVMLVFPGQGLLTILIGLILVDFPGKYRYQRWLISRGPVLRAANWLREKGEKKPLVLH